MSPIITPIVVLIARLTYKSNNQRFCQYVIAIYEKCFLRSLPLRGLASFEPTAVSTHTPPLPKSTVGSNLI